MINPSSSLLIQIKATANQPLDLYELQLDDGTHYFSTENITWGGHNYLNQVVSRSAIKKYVDEQSDNVTVTFSNVDTTMAQILYGQDIEGRILVIRRIDRTVSDDSIVLFWGPLSQPSKGDEDQIEVQAVELLAGIDQDAPGRSFTVNCNWIFKSPECTYTGSGASCNKTWAQCSAYGNTNNYGGQRFVPQTGSYQYEALLDSRRGKQKVTATFTAVDDQPYDVPVPLLYGRVAIAGILLEHVDAGSLQNSLSAFGQGPISDIIYVQVNGKSIKSAYTNHLGEMGGVGTQTVDSRFPGGYPYSLLAYIGCVVPEDPANPADPPALTGVVLGRLVQLADGGLFDIVQWTDNPVLNFRDYLMLSRRQGGLGIPQSLLNDVVNNDTQAYCNETVQNYTNDQTIYTPTGLASDVVLGVDYRLYQSTGVIGGLGPDHDGPYVDFDGDTDVSPTAVPMKRFTMNVAIAERQAAVDVIWQKLLPTFRGYINYDQYGKICIRSERPVLNTTVAAAAAIGATSVTMAAMPFSVGQVILLSPYTAKAEALTIASIAGNVATFTAACAFAHAVNDGAWQVQMAFTDANVTGKMQYPLTADQQSATNRITAKYVNSTVGFEPDSVVIDDEENQEKTLKINNEDVDLSGCDSFFQAYRIASWMMAKYRKLNKFIQVPGNISASLLETGDVFCVSCTEFGLQCVPFRVVELDLLENDECTVTGQLYDIAIYNDEAPQTSVRIPGIFNPVTPGSPGAPAAVTPVVMDSLTVSFDAVGNVIPLVVYTPPVSDTNFVGVHAYLEAPDASSAAPITSGTTPLGSGVMQPQNARIDLGKFPVGTLSGGQFTLQLPSQPAPAAIQSWRVILGAYGVSYDPEVVPAYESGATPSLTVSVGPTPTSGIGQEYAPQVTGFALIGQAQASFASGSWRYRQGFVFNCPLPGNSQQSFSGVNLVFTPIKDTVTGLSLTLPQTTRFIPSNPGGPVYYVTDYAEIPQDQELFRVDAIGVDGQGRANSYSLGITPSVTFVTPKLDPTGVDTPGTLVPDVTDFSVTAAYGANPAGIVQLLLTPFFQAPDASSGWRNIAFIAEVPAGSGNYINLGGPSVGDGSWGDKAQIPHEFWPTTPQTWNFWADSVDVNGNLKYPTAGVFGTSPMVSVVIPIATGTPGSATEFGQLVTGASASDFFDLTADGTEVYGFAATWTDPVDDLVQGITPTVVFSADPTNPRYLGDVAKGVGTYKSGNLPMGAPDTCVLYLLSYDASGRRNSIVPGVTPGFAFSISVRTAGSIDMGRALPSSLGGGLTGGGGTLPSVRTGGGLGLTSGAVAANTGAGITIAGGALAVNAGGGINLSGGTTNVAPGDGIEISGGTVTANSGPGLQNAGGQITILAGNGITLAGGSTNVATGGGTTIGGGLVIVSTGVGLQVSGSNVITNPGSGLQNAGSNITINNGTGITFSGSQVVVSIGSGLTISGSQVVVNPDGSSLVLSGGKVGISTTWVYPGTILCTQLVAGTVAANIGLTSPTITITGSAFTCNIDSTNGIKITTAAYGVLTMGGGGLNVQNSSNVGATVHPGSITIYNDLAGSHAIVLVANSSNPTIQIGPSGSGFLQIGGQQVLTNRQTGPGSPSGISTTSALVAWCFGLYSALNPSGMGMINY